MKGTRGFTLIELLVVIAIIALLMGILMPALQRVKKIAQGIACTSNLRTLMIAWRMYADSNDDRLVACQDGMPGRPNWISGNLNFSSSAVNWDLESNLTTGPLWTYAGKNAKVFKCPADTARVTNSQGRSIPRVRSNSMSQVFGYGEWLNSSPASRQQDVWRTYSKFTSIVHPARTWVFVDEHPDSINDAAFANACTDASNASAARIIDYPANYHGGSCGFSFSDGHAVVHKWEGSKIKNAPIYNGARNLQLNVPAEDSWVDVQWMAENTTVKK
ncbi:MAG: type II secretion system protein [Planctomycetota bacterium]|jgi:prepilin-type N-terminal cleavage/methylation domain-containing protein